jgi:MFS family permease
VKWQNHNLGTTVHGIQTAITLFALTMAALMISGSKLTEIWGRKTCFVLGLTVYGLGALIAALAPALGVLTVGYSLLEGVGSALLIPPVYILITVSFLDLPSRAKSFGIVSAAGGIGAAAGPLIGGLITSTISWRPHFSGVLLPHPLQRTGKQRAALTHPPVPQPHLQPRVGDTKHPMAHPAGQLLRGLGLPANGAPFQRHSDRPDAHPGDHRHSALLDDYRWESC